MYSLSFCIFLLSLAKLNSSLEFAVNSLTKLLQSDLDTLDKAIDTEINYLGSIVDYQSGSVINIPSEINDFPKLINNTATNINIFGNILIGIFNLLKSDYNKQNVAESGVIISIPNSQVEPYVSSFTTLTNDIRSLISGIQSIGFAITGAIEPALVSQSFSGGNIYLPASAVDNIANTGANIASLLGSISNTIKTSQSKSAAVEIRNESFKSSTVMKIVNSFMATLATDIMYLSTEINKYINILPITEYSSSTLYVDVKQILIAMNNAFFSIKGLLPKVQGYLSTGLNDLQFLQNPIADAFINFI